MKQTTKHWLREWIETIIVAVLLALVVRVFLVEAYKIPSSSMVPTLQRGDKIFVTKCLYGPKIPFTGLRIPGIRGPERGEVIVFKYPVDQKKNFVKRLIAFGGERVEIRDGNIYVNGEELKMDPIDSIYYTNAHPFGNEGQVIEVPEDMYFVLGDNSGNSRDSRMWGFVPKENLVGKALVIWWPIPRIGKLK